MPSCAPPADPLLLHNQLYFWHAILSRISHHFGCKNGWSWGEPAHWSAARESLSLAFEALNRGHLYADTPVWSQLLLYTQGLAKETPAYERKGKEAPYHNWWQCPVSMLWVMTVLDNTANWQAGEQKTMLCLSWCLPGVSSTCRQYTLFLWDILSLSVV